TDERDVVARADRLVAMATTRGGTDQAAPLRQTDDADVKETADGAAQQEQHDEQKHAPHSQEHALTVGASGDGRKLGRARLSGDNRGKNEGEALTLSPSLPTIGITSYNRV